MSAITLAASEVTERASIPMITHSFADQITSRGYRYIFQVAPKATTFGEKQFQYALDIAAKASVDVVIDDGYPRGITDVAPLVNKLHRSDTQEVFPVSCFNDGLLIIRTMRQQRINMPVIGGAGRLHRARRGDRSAGRGMNFLRDHKVATGCMSLRIMTNLNEDGAPCQETSVAAYFLSLARLEGWAASHETHLDIYRHAIDMNRLHQEKREVVTWHELFVLQDGHAFEYVNCHPATGVLPFAELWAPA